MDSICDLWLWVCFVVCCGFVLWCCVGSGRAVFCGAVGFFFFFFFSCCGLVVVVAVGAVDVFLSSEIYYFIAVVILFYCDICIILLC